MATGGTGRLYEEDDLVDSILMHKVSEFIMFDKLPALASHLRITDAEFSRLQGDRLPADQTTYWVVKRWYDKTHRKVRDLVAAMEEWNRKGFLDTEVWNHIRSYINPAALPAPPSGPSVPVSSSSYTSAQPGMGKTSSIAKLALDWWPEDLNMQKRLKNSLQRDWDESLSHDWLEPHKARTFPTREYYVGLRWTKKDKRVMKDVQIRLKHIHDILRIGNQCEGATNILVEGQPGMGKTSSMAKLALDWRPECPDDDNPVNQFHFVFLLKMSDVDKTSTLPEIIIAQHCKLKTSDKDRIQSILEGETNHKVLLLLDGYDEYKPGTNKDIDRAIEHSIGNCFLILTSRPGSDSGDGSYIYVSQEIRRKMDGEVTIEGFDDKSIIEASTQFLDSKEKSSAMLRQCKETGIYELLKIPIILLMTCVIFDERQTLPRTKTELYDTLFEILIDRTGMKTFSPGLYADVKDMIEDLLFTLGEFSWKALQQDVGQLLLEKEKLEQKPESILKLGLLFEVGMSRATVTRQPTFLSFQHKSLQEFSAAKYITIKLERAAYQKATLKEFFPSWAVVRKQSEVVKFCVGLMSDPTPLVAHVYGLQVEEILKDLRSYGVYGSSPLEEALLASLYRESRVQLPGDVLHNPWINYYDHWKDDHDGYNSRDTTPVFVPSRLYLFNYMKEGVECLTTNSHEEIPESALYINMYNKGVGDSILQTCRTICQRQKLTDLRISWLKCVNISTDVFRLSPNAKSVCLYTCYLPPAVMKNLLQQLSHCTKLTTLVLLWTPVTGLLPEFKPDSPSLHILRLAGTRLNEADVCHLTHLIQTNKLPGLKELSLHYNNLRDMEDEAGELIEACVTHYQRELELYMKYNHLSEGFKKKWKQRCKGTNVKLRWRRGTSSDHV